MNTITRSWIVPALVCALGVAGAVLGTPDPATRSPEYAAYAAGIVDAGEPPRTYADDARALLSGLAVGDVIEGGWRVTEIYGPEEARIFVLLELGDVEVTIIVITRVDPDEEHPAPLAVGPYDLYYIVPPDAGLPLGAVDSAIGGVAVRIDDTRSMPEGM